MKVKELIANLKEYDPDLEVVATTYRGEAGISDIYKEHCVVVLATEWYMLPVPDRE